MKKLIRTAVGFYRDETGVALIITMLVSMLLLGLGVALSTNSMFEMEVASNHEREALAFYAAQTGLERATDGFRTNYTVNSIPADGTLVFDHVSVTYPGSSVTSNYTVTLSRRDSPNGSIIFPYPIFYTITSVGQLVPANASARPSSVTLAQTLSITPRTLANYTLFYDRFQGPISFQSTFRLSGRLAVNDPNGVSTYSGTTINGDFYAAGAINRTPPYGPPLVSGNLVENGGVFSFPTTVNPFSAGAASNYQYTGTTRMIFNSDGTVLVYNNALSGGSQVVPLPPNGIMSVTGGDVIVEGTVSGRVTVTGDDDILVNGNIRYADQSANSWDTLALVAPGDIVIPQKLYTGTTGGTLQNFEAHWAQVYLTDYITGGTFGTTALPANLYIDGTLVSLSGSSPSVINPLNRPPGQLYVYGNSIAKRASVTVRMSGNNIINGYNENYIENKKLDMLPPPGFPMDTRVLPTFFAFREVRTALQ